MKREAKTCDSDFGVGGRRCGLPATVRVTDREGKTGRVCSTCLPLGDYATSVALPTTQDEPEGRLALVERAVRAAIASERQVLATGSVGPHNTVAAIVASVFEETEEAKP